MRFLLFVSIRRNTRTVLGILSLFTAIALLAQSAVLPLTVSAGAPDSVVQTPQAVFEGTGAGPIPDGQSGTPPQFGAPRVISFAVSGLTSNVIDVQVSFTGEHTWIGDVDVVLSAPGGDPSHVLVSRIGVQSVGAFGSPGDYDGTYVFSDTSVAPNIWTAAATSPVPPDTYRTTQGGGPGQANPPPITSLNSTFGGLSPAQANGTWTLSVRDAAASDTGTITSATLTLNATSGPVSQHIVDFDGDGRTDPSLVRNTGGGPSGQITWFNSNSSGTPVSTTTPWGLLTDRLTPEDFDGDGKTDIAVWREGPPFSSFFYILQSQSGTLRTDQFGQTGDDPTVVGDYDGDGMSDPAVWRQGAGAGNPGFWYFRSSVSGAIIGTQFGQNGDTPAPGDYDGDGAFDFAVQRSVGGQGVFFIRQSTDGDTSVQFGQPTDTIVPGDYDGDGKYDIATTRSSGAAIQWFVRRSSDGVINSFTFGVSATDFLTQGDWDGDGKTDISVWRPNANPALNFFYWRRSSDGVVAHTEWGQNGDIPVASYNSH